MNKKDLKFTIGLTILMGVLWAIGELVMGLWVAVVPKAHIFWLALIVIITLVVNVWHSMTNQTLLTQNVQNTSAKPLNARKNNGGRYVS